MPGTRPRTSELRHTAAIAAVLLVSSVVAIVAALASAGSADAGDRMRRADSRLTLDPLGAFGVVREAAPGGAPLAPAPGFRQAFAASATGAPAAHLADRTSAVHARERLGFGWPSRIAALGRGALAPPLG
jgi:hypothetical protein